MHLWKRSLLTAVMAAFLLAGCKDEPRTEEPNTFAPLPKNGPVGESGGRPKKGISAPPPNAKNDAASSEAP